MALIGNSPFTAKDVQHHYMEILDIELQLKKKVGQTYPNQMYAKYDCDANPCFNDLRIPALFQG